MGEQSNDDLATLEVPFGIRIELDLPTGPASVVTVDGVAQTGPLGAGRHRIRVEAAQIVD